MSQKLKVFLALLVVLIIPIALFLLLSNKRDKTRLMPEYHFPIGKEIIQDGNKIIEQIKYKQVSDITLVNQMGDTISLNKDLKDKILIINFFFSSCPSICPNMSHHVSVMQKSFLKKIPEKFQFITISIDPENDTVDAIREYANRYTTHHDKWWFLTGNKKEIFNYMKNELGLKLDSEDPNHIDHSTTTVLVDMKRYIRGYYNTLDVVELEQCARDAVFLTMEKEKKKPN